jgi:protein-export membrane protein SecD
MFKSRAVQYLALALLVAVAGAIIFLPVGAAPRPQEYTLTLESAKPFAALAGKKTPAMAADEALDVAFKSPERVPQELEVLPDATPAPGTSGASKGKTAGAPKVFQARIRDTASTQAEAQERADRIAAALAKPFKGVRLAGIDSQSLSSLPARPLFSLGSLAVYPPRERNGQIRPAVKLGLDLQGGVNLVLQVRRALFRYKIDPAFAKTLTTNEARDAFARQVRAALATTPGNLGLAQADVNFAVNASDTAADASTGGANSSAANSNIIEVRTQASDKANFDQQRAAIREALGQALPKARLAEAREPQFFDPAGDPNAGAGVSTAVLDRTVEIVRSRVDSLGVAEPQIQAQPPDRILVQLPGVSDPARAQEVIGRTAQMSIVLLPQDIEVTERGGETLFFDSATKAPIAPEIAKQRSTPIVSGTDIKPTARAGSDGTKPAVFFELQGPGATRFGQITAQNINRFMPIFLDERCISAPTIQSAITGGSGQISGGFADIKEAQDLALLLNSGALPAPIDVVENRTVSATLGQDSLEKSVRAGAIGIVAVLIFMIVFYRLPGALANIALAVYFLLNLALFILVGGTLTLPGIAGFLLAVAMSLDTNILVFERLREEMAIQASFSAALRAAFSRAWTAILDSHVTTLIAAVVLFFLGTGPVKGFALTLGIGVILSLFSAISVTRLLMWSFAGVGERSPGLFPRPIARENSPATAATSPR